MKKCPYCAEEIQDAAIKCKHCGSEVPAPAVKKPINITPMGVVFTIVCIAFLLSVLWTFTLPGVFDKKPKPTPIYRVNEPPSAEEKQQAYQAGFEYGYYFTRALEGYPSDRDDALPEKYRNATKYKADVDRGQRDGAIKARRELGISLD